MFQDSASKPQHPAITTCLCQEKQSYKIKTSDGIIYQKTQAHLKPYTPQIKQPMTQPHHKQPMKQLLTQPDHKQPLQDGNPSQVPTS